MNNSDKAKEYNKDGLRLYDRKDYLKAADLFQKASELLPENATYLYNAGNAYLAEVVSKHGPYRNEVKEYFMKAAEKGSVLALFGLGKVYDPCLYEDFAAGADRKKALDYYRRYLDEAETAADNVASQRVLARVGFEATGETGEEGPRYVMRPRAR